MNSRAIPEVSQVPLSDNMQACSHTSPGPNRSIHLTQISLAQAAPADSYGVLPSTSCMSTRIGHVQAMLAAARDMGVSRASLIKDNASRDKVNSFIILLRSAAGTRGFASELRAAEEAYQQYSKTWAPQGVQAAQGPAVPAAPAAPAVPAAVPAAPPPAPRTRELRGKSFLFT